MSFEDIHLIDNETTGNSIIKRDFSKIYYQQTANLTDSDQSIEFIFGENNKCHQIGKGYLRYELTIRKGFAIARIRIFVIGDAIRLQNNAFAYCFKATRFIKTEGSDKEHGKYFGQVSTLMRALTSKERDVICYFGKFDESEAGMGNTSQHHQLNSNHDLPANKDRIGGQLSIEYIFGLFKTFKKISKQLRFRLFFKTADLQDFFYTTLATLDSKSKVYFDTLFLYVPIIIPDAQTQILFKVSLKNSFTLSFDSLNTDRKTVDAQLEHQVNIGSAQKINSPKYLIVAH